MFTTLRSKIYAGFGVIIAINVVFALWAIFQFSMIGNEVNTNVAEHYALTAQSIRLSRIAEEQYRVLHRANVGDFTAEEAGLRLENLAKEFTITLAKIPVNLRERDSVLLLHIVQSSQRLDSLSAGFLRGSYRRQGISSNRYLLDTLYSAVQQVERNCSALADLSKEQIDAVQADLGDELRRILFVIGIGTLVAVLLGVIGGSFYSRWALRPIKRLQQAVKNVGSGQLGQRVRITTADELGDLSFEFNRMIEQLRRYEEMNLENLLLEKRKAEAIVESITTPIIVVGKDMQILLVNVSALRLFRKPIHSTLEGHDVTDLTDDENIIHTMQSLVESREESEAAISESLTWMTETEGMERYYLVQMIPLKTSGGTGGGIAIFADVTEFKELDRLKSEFLARISHEFRTPLSSILMSVDILREELLGEINKRQRELLDNAKEDCRRLSRLINDILEMSRLESGPGQKTREEFNPAELALSVLQPHLLIAEKQGIRLEHSLDGSLPTVYADPEHFRWILNNLVSNAIRYTEEGGSVEVEMAVVNDVFQLVVRDTGTGIPADSLQMIFERFYQVEQGERATPGSVGLGLAVVKEVVESYRGTIAVSSELNKGATFTVQIPMQELGGKFEV